MHGKIDDDADVGHPRWERPDAGDGYGEDVLARERLLDGGDRRIEALDMADHQRHAGAARGADDVAPFFDAGGHRFLDQDVDLARDTGERDLMMQMGGRRNRDRLDAFGEELVKRFEGAA